MDGRLRGAPASARDAAQDRSRFCGKLGASGYRGGYLGPCGLLGNTSRSNAAEALPLALREVGEEVSVHVELKVRSKKEQMVKHSAPDSAAGAPPGRTCSPWMTLQQSRVSTDRATHSANETKSPRSRMLRSVRWDARFSSLRRILALYHAVTCLHCRLGVCRERLRTMLGVW